MRAGFIKLPQVLKYFYEAGIKPSNSLTVLRCGSRVLGGGGGGEAWTRARRGLQPAQRHSEEGRFQHCLPEKLEAALKTGFMGRLAKSLRTNRIQTGPSLTPELLRSHFNVLCLKK